MATSILAQIGFGFAKSSVNNFIHETTIIKDSIINLGPVFKQFKKNVEGVERITKITGLGLALKDTFAGVKDIVGSSVNGIKKLYDFAEDYAKSGDKIAKTSRLVGLSVKDYQALSYAAEDSGMSIEEMDSALKKFNVNLAKARGGDKTMLGNFSKALFGKDASPKKLAGLKTNRDVIVELASSYSKLKTSEEKAFVSSELFGKSGLKMAEILSQGGDSLEKFLDAYKGGFSGTGAENAERFTHELQKMQKEFSDIKVSVMQDLFPTFIEIFKMVQGNLKENGTELKKSLKGVFIYALDFVKVVLPKIPKVLDNIVKIVKFLGPKLSIMVGSIIAFAPAISQILVGVIAFLPAIKSVSLFLLKGFRIFPMILSILPTILSVVSAISAVVGGTILGPVLAISAVLVGIVAIVKQIYDNWDMLWNTSLEEYFEASKAVFSDFCDWIYEKLGESMTKSIRDTLKSIPVFGRVAKFFMDDVDFSSVDAELSKNDIGGQAQDLIQRQTVTNRFAVDFNNVPRGTNITPPPQGDFDWSRSYTLAGAV